MCTFGEQMQTEAPEEPKDDAPPLSVRTKLVFGSDDEGLTERYRSVFLERISGHVGAILRKPIDQKRWCFTRYILELNSKGWGEFHVPATCLMFQYHDRLRELLTLMSHPILNPNRITGILIHSTSYRKEDMEKGRVRWMRYGEWSGTDELLVYGLRDRRDLLAGRLALLGPQERSQLMTHIRECLSGINASS